MVNQVVARGAFLALIALYFVIQAPALTVGSFSRPGAGLFPLFVGGLLLLVAIVIIVRSRFIASEPLDFKLRNIALVTASLLAFVAVTEYVNMIAAIAVMVGIASLAVDDRSLRRTVVIAACLCLVAVAMRKGLGVQLPLY